MKLTKAIVRKVILGSAVGDALGLIKETMTYVQIRELYGDRLDQYVPGSHKYFDVYEPGMTSDDTQLTLATMRAIIYSGNIDMDAIAREHVAAMNDSTAGWGGSTIAAIKKIESGVPWQESGKNDQPGRGEGNGVVMKLAPLILYHLAKQSYSDNELEQVMFEDLYNFTTMTHHSPMAVEASFILATLMIDVFIGETRDFEELFGFFDSYSFAAGEIYAAKSQSERFLLENDLCTILDQLPLYHMEHLEKALFNGEYGDGSCHLLQSIPVTLGLIALYHDSPRCIIEAANFGGDTDTNAAMVGALYGLQGNRVSDLPQHLIEGLLQRDEILQTVEQFCHVLGITD